MDIKKILAQAKSLEQALPEALATSYAMDASLAKFIDHTILKPEATPAQIEVLCADARKYGFATVCVNPIFVPMCSELLNSSGVDVCTVVGFPLGADPAAVKAAEARDAIRHGAVEIDMVQAVGMLKGEAYQLVYDDIHAVAEACHEDHAILKVILETCLLSDREKIIACLLCKEAGADFVKTSTGFNSGGATAADIRLMRAVVGPVMGVKAAGGVRSLADARTMLDAGATRLGASAGVAIMKDILGD